MTVMASANVAKVLKTEFNKVIDQSEEGCKQGSKTSLLGFLPAFFTGAASVLKTFKAPEFVWKNVENLAKADFNRCADATATYSAKTAGTVAKAAFGVAVDSCTWTSKCSKSTGGFISRAYSWFRG